MVCQVIWHLWFAKIFYRIHPLVNFISVQSFLVPIFHKRIKLQDSSPISHNHYFHPSCFIFCLCIIMFNGLIFLTYTHSPTLSHISIRKNNMLFLCTTFHSIIMLFFYHTISNSEYIQHLFNYIFFISYQCKFLISRNNLNKK
jgi:hypothetical protein